VIVLIPEVTDPDDISQAEVLADFKQAWQEAMTGKTIPVAQLWEWQHQRSLSPMADTIF
jgi:hypothetical protein